jgi:LysM repeat protein
MKTLFTKISFLTLLSFAISYINVSAQKMIDRGLGEVILDGKNTGKNLILHRELPVGTMVTIRNPANGRTTTAKVVSRLPDTGSNEKLIAKISQSTYNDLAATGKRFALELYPSSKPSTAEIKHEVIAGETLYSISKQYKVSIDEVKKWNQLEDDVLSLGQKLKIVKK